MFADIMEHCSDWENKDEICEYLLKILDKQAFDHAGLIYGMGHAVYTLSDPRAVILKKFAKSLSEEKFRIFNEKIVHTSKYRVIGVRMPDLKAIAKEHRADYKEIFELPYDSFEEIIRKGGAVGFADAPLCEKEPYIIRYAEMIDNWAECDCFCSCIKVKKSEEDDLLRLAERLMYRKEEFVSRVGTVLMFSKFSDEPTVRKALAIYDRLPSGEYYRDMAVAWGISVYCVKYPQLIVKYLEHSPISIAVKLAAAQKIRDSRRISDEVKHRVTDTVNLQR